MRRLRIVMVGLVVTTTLWVGIARAQSSPDGTRCEDEGNAFSPDVQISACTAVIQSGRVTGDHLANAHFHRGNAYRAQGDYDRAIADYSTAIEIDPKAHFYAARAVSHHAKADRDRALADNSKAIEIDPQFAAAYYNRSILYHEKGDNDRAIVDLTRSIELNPQNATAYINRGLVHNAKGDYDRAMADYTKAIEIDPNFAPALNSRCWLRATANRDLALALADCDRAVAISSKVAAYLDSRGFVYLRLNRLDEALADYDAGVNIDAKDAYLLYGRGLAKIRKGNPAGGDADIAAAKAIKADIAEEFAKWGVLDLAEDATATVQGTTRFAIPPPTTSTGTVQFVAVGGSCSFSLDGTAKGRGSTLKLEEVPPGEYVVECATPERTQSRTVVVRAGETAMAMFKI